MFYLNTLLSSIIATYFTNSMCLFHFYDDILNAFQLEHIPVISRYSSNGDDELFLTNQEKCEDFLVQSQNSTSFFELIEESIFNYNEVNDARYTYNNRKYIIILTDKISFDSFFASAYLRNVQNILVIFPRSDNVFIQDDSWNLLQFWNDSHERDELVIDLFTHKYIGKEGNNDPVWMDAWFTSNGSFQMNNNLYPDKMTNQQGRTFAGICYDIIPYAVCNSDPPKGNEHNLIHKYVKQFNLSLSINITTSEYYSNALRLLKENQYFDIVYGGVPYDELDSIRTIIYTYIVMVPIPSLKYGYFTLFEVFDWTVWISVVSVYIIIRGVVYIRQLITKYPMKSRESYINSLELYGILLYQPINLSNRIKHRRFYNYINILMLLTCIVLTTAFSSRLSSVLISPVYDHDINTLTELAASDLGLLFFDEGYDEGIANDTRLVYQELYHKVVMFEDMEDYYGLQNKLETREFAVALYRRLSGVFNEDPWLLMLIKEKFKSIIPELYTGYNYLALRSNSMHTNELKKLVMTAQEAGLFIFWEDDALRLIEADTFYKDMQDLSVTKKNGILNMHHLKGIFAFWGGGMIISCFGLSFECFLKIKTGTYLGN